MGSHTVRNHRLLYCNWYLYTNQAPAVNAAVEVVFGTLPLLLSTWSTLAMQQPRKCHLTGYALRCTTIIMCSFALVWVHTLIMNADTHRYTLQPTEHSMYIKWTVHGSTVLCIYKIESKLHTCTTHVQLLTPCMGIQYTLCVQHYCASHWITERCTIEWTKVQFCYEDLLLCHQ